MSGGMSSADLIHVRKLQRGALATPSERYGLGPDLELWIAWPTDEEQVPAPKILLGRPGAPVEACHDNENLDGCWLQLTFSPTLMLAVPGGSDLLRLFYADRLDSCLRPEAAVLSGIQSACRRMWEERCAMQPGWRAAESALLIDILVQLMRCQLGVEAEGQGYPDNQMLSVIAHMLGHLSEELSINDLARRYGKGKTSFTNGFKRVTGLSPIRYIQSLRMQRAMQLLQNTDKTVTEIAYECGYQSLSYFNKHFKAYRQLSPREHRHLAQRRRKMAREASYA